MAKEIDLALTATQPAHHKILDVVLLFPLVIFAAVLAFFGRRIFRSEFIHQLLKSFLPILLGSTALYFGYLRRHQEVGKARTRPFRAVLIAGYFVFPQMAVLARRIEHRFPFAALTADNSIRDAPACFPRRIRAALSEFGGRNRFGLAHQAEIPQSSADGARPHLLQLADLAVREPLAKEFGDLGV